MDKYQTISEYFDECEQTNRYSDEKAINSLTKEGSVSGARASKEDREEKFYVEMVLTEARARKILQTKDIKVTVSNLTKGVITRTGEFEVVKTHSVYEDMEWRDRWNYDSYVPNGMTHIRAGNINFVWARVPYTKAGHIHEVIICKPEDYVKILSKIKKAVRNNIKVIKPILEEDFLQDLLDNTVHFLRSCARFPEYNTNLNRGVVLSGEPGNGKTMFARYIKAICDKKGYSHATYTSQQLMSSPDLESVMNSNRVVFFDDIDLKIFDRQTDQGNTLLSAMDGMHENRKGCVRIFTTNEKFEEVDAAFMRPGRIDKIFQFEKPNLKLRTKFVNSWHEDLRNEKIPKLTDGMSFATIGAIKDNLARSIICGYGWDLQRCMEEIHVIEPEKKVGFG